MGLLKGLLLSTAVCALVYFFRLTMLPSRTWYDEADSFENEDTSAVWVGSVSSAFWLYPLIAGSYLMASTWTTGVAEAAYSAQNVKVAGIRQRLQATTWVEHVCRLALIVNYSVVCFGLQCIPYLGPPLAFLVMSMVDGYFCFEQIWAVRGWSLEKVRCKTHTAPPLQRVALVVPDRLRRAVDRRVLFPPERALELDAFYARLSDLFGARIACGSPATEHGTRVAGRGAADCAAGGSLQGAVALAPCAYSPLLAHGTLPPVAGRARRAGHQPVCPARRVEHAAQEVRPSRHAVERPPPLRRAVCGRCVDECAGDTEPASLRSASAACTVACIGGEHSYGRRPIDARRAQVSKDGVMIVQRMSVALWIVESRIQANVARRRADKHLDAALGLQPLLLGRVPD